MKVCFYTLGDASIGLGHIYRCLALANVAKRDFNWQMEFALRKNTEGVAVVAKHNFPFVVLEDGEIPDGKWRVILLDQPSVDPIEVQSLKLPGRTIVSLDDTGPGHFEVDLAFNVLYRCRQPRPGYSDTDSRFGLKYVVTDPKFAGQDYSVKPEVKNVILTQGGADTHGIVPRLVGHISGWLSENREITLHVHTGPAFRFEVELASALASMVSPVYVHRDIGDMSGLMQQMDIAISGIGLMACELAAVGVPSILVTGEEKELETAAIFEARGMAIVIGKYTSEIEKPLYDSLNRLNADQDFRKQLSNAAQFNVDGAGANRILAAIEDRV